MMENLAIIGGIYLGISLWSWYQEQRAKYLFGKAYRAMMTKHAPYWQAVFQKHFKEEMNEP